MHENRSRERERKAGLMCEDYLMSVTPHIVPSVHFSGCHCCVTQLHWGHTTHTHLRCALNEIVDLTYDDRRLEIRWRRIAVTSSPMHDSSTHQPNYIRPLSLTLSLTDTLTLSWDIHIPGWFQLVFSNYRWFIILSFSISHSLPHSFSHFHLCWSPPACYE